MATPDSEQVVHLYHLAIDLIAKIEIALKPEELERLQQRLQAEAIRSSKEDFRKIQCLVHLVQMVRDDR